MHIDDSGVLTTAQWIASPNYDQRPADTEVSLLIIHNISLPPNEFSGQGVIDLFTNRIDPAAHPYYQALQGLKVSAHFFIRRDGTLIQFVPCSQRAWHAGVSSWQGRERCNDFSIGVELEGSDITPFTDTQYEVLITLTQCLCSRYPIQHITGHSDVAPGRKTDPGPNFDWKKYASAFATPAYFKVEYFS